MLFNTKLASFAILAAAVGVQGQSASASAAIPSGISNCVITCVTQAASSAGCSSFTDLTCVCTNQDFLTAATSCLQSTCTSADQQAALALQSQECGSLAASSGASGSSDAASSTPAPTASVTTVSGSSGSSAVLVTSSGSGSGSSTLSFPSSSGSASGSASPSGSSSASRKDFGVNVQGIVGAGVAVVAAVVGAGLVL